MQQALADNLRRFQNFLNFAQAYVRRNNPLQMIVAQLASMLKDLLNINKKRRMARYRLGHQMHQLSKMEQLIAQNASHYFLQQGNKLNQTR